MNMKRIFTIYLLIVTLVLISCKKEQEKQEQSQSQSQLFFQSPIGTKWVYYNIYTDTTVWQYTAVESIDNAPVIELSKTQMVTNRNLYKQEGNKIFKYAEYVGSTHYNINAPLSNSDSLIVLSEPSLEYVIDEAIGFNWNRKILSHEGDTYNEKDVFMEVIAHEPVETGIGIFQCTVIKDEFDIYYYVAKEGLIKTEFSTVLNDTLVEFSNILIEKS